jgi:hypothetical protein
MLGITTRTLESRRQAGKIPRPYREEHDTPIWNLESPEMHKLVYGKKEKSADEDQDGI